MKRAFLQHYSSIPKHIDDCIVFINREQIKKIRKNEVFGRALVFILEKWSHLAFEPTFLKILSGKSKHANINSHNLSKGFYQKVIHQDLKRIRAHATLCSHITYLMGGLFSNWKQISKTFLAYCDYMRNSIQYDLEIKRCPNIDKNMQNDNNKLSEKVTKLYIKRFNELPFHQSTTDRYTNSSKILKLAKKFDSIINERKEISKTELQHVNHVIKIHPLM